MLNMMPNMMLKQLFKITASCAVVLALSVTVHAQPIVELADNLSFEGPVPTVSVIIPNEYRGRILIERTDSKDPVPQQFSHRDFQFPINEKGYVAIKQTPLLRKADPIDLRLVYEDGSEIPVERTDSGDGEVVLRYVTVGFYVLDNKEEYDLLHRDVFHYIDGKPNHITADYDAVKRLFSNAASEEVIQHGTEN